MPQGEGRLFFTRSFSSVDFSAESSMAVDDSDDTADDIIETTSSSCFKSSANMAKAVLWHPPLQY